MPDPQDWFGSFVNERLGPGPSDSPKHPILEALGLGSDYHPLRALRRAVGGAIEGLGDLPLTITPRGVVPLPEAVKHGLSTAGHFVAGEDGLAHQITGDSEEYKSGRAIGPFVLPYGTLNKGAEAVAERLGVAASHTPEAMAKKLLAHSAGATLEPRTLAPTMESGYMVADPHFTKTFGAGEHQQADLAMWLKDPSVRARIKRGGYWGVWRDPETGVLEVNISDRLKTRDEALKLGARRSQKAIGHLQNGAYQGDIAVPPPAAPTRRPEAVMARLRPTEDLVNSYASKDWRLLIERALRPLANERGAAGVPDVLYHGSTKDFPTFRLSPHDVGIHAGTPEQAADRVLSAPDLDRPAGSAGLPMSPETAARITGREPDFWTQPQLMEGANIKPVRFNLQNPIRLSADPVDFNAGREGFLDLLTKAGALTPDEATRIFAARHEGGTDQLRALLKSKGYDGLVYPNEGEGAGDALSYAVFDPKQISSAITGRRFGTSGASILGGMTLGGGAGAYAGSQVGDTPQERARNALIGLGIGMATGGVAGPAVEAAGERGFARAANALSNERGAVGVQPELFAPQVLTRPEGGATIPLDVSIRPEGVDLSRPELFRPQRADLSALDPVKRRIRSVYTPAAIRGLEENPTGAAWYDLSPLRRIFENESPTGAQDFQMFTRFMGPTSAGTDVPMNIRQASLWYKLWKNGVLTPEAVAQKALQIPKGYANRLNIRPGISRILSEGSLDPLSTPKTFRYSGQLGGRNWGGVALDRHVGYNIGVPGNIIGSDVNGGSALGRAFPTGTPGKVATSPMNTHYAAIEDAMIREAEKLGVPPAVYQAAGWVGNAAKTGVEDARHPLEIINAKLPATAKKYGHATNLDALLAFIRGQSPLWGLAGLAAAGAAGSDR